MRRVASPVLSFGRGSDSKGRMNHRLALFLCLVPLGIPAWTSGQQPPMPPVRQRVILPPGSPSLQPPGSAEAPLLSRNFRITLTAKKGDASGGELSALTCHPQVHLSGPLDSSETPTQVTIDGSITEEGELLRFDYALSFQVAVLEMSQTSGPDGVVSRSVRWQNHECQGSVRMKAGTACEVLRAGGAAYSLMVAPEVNP